MTEDEECSAKKCLLAWALRTIGILWLKQKQKWIFQEGSSLATSPSSCCPVIPPTLQPLPYPGLPLHLDSLPMAPPPNRPCRGPQPSTFLADAGAVDGRAGDGIFAGAACGAIDSVGVRGQRLAQCGP